ncbi:MAG: DUF1592 domain-containing protein [Verrucomicrobiota bacterium]
MHRFGLICVLALCASVGRGGASLAILERHCAKCHNEEKAKGKFMLGDLGEDPSSDTLEHWLDVLDLVVAEEMPPEDESTLSASQRNQLIAYLEDRLEKFESATAEVSKSKPRRLNNREFENSVRDVLLIEDIGTNQPTDNLVGDSLFHGFDTHSDTLGFSKFHLEQYLDAVRSIVDATILEGPRPEANRIEVDSTSIYSEHHRQNSGRPDRRGRSEGFDFFDPRQSAYLAPFRTVPETGYYRVKIRATGLDRDVYSPDDTGVYPGDSIRLVVRMGDRKRTFNLPDEEVMEIELREWLAAGTRFRLEYPTDGLKMRGNGNFKFQYAIGGYHLKENDPDRWKAIVDALKPNRSGRMRHADSWHHWVDYWQGPRPRVHGAVVEGPFFESWPPRRQVALLGEDPSVEKAEEILRPIAERAWRRPLREGELDGILVMVEKKAKSLGDIAALKEGIVAILVSPAFLLVNTEDLSPGDLFASKFSYFLKATLPDERLRGMASSGKLDSFATVRDELQRVLERGQADEFLRAFPFGWLELNDINFMAPDPDNYHFFHRKDLSEDMIEEVVRFFGNVVENNLPITEFLSADYSFVNADLAKVYGLEDVPQTSEFRRYTFDDGRRGGLLGMGAFLTSTADSLGTSPIHRAVYVMENFMGIHPTPPPPDVEITEPDVRQAKTIKEVLAAHVSDENCASCHETIDPWGYAFENFDPTGAWRESYTVPAALSLDENGEAVPVDRRRGKSGDSVPIDASARFRSGAEYEDITGFRKHILSEANRDRFVRCFVTKLLTYANGVEPSEEDFGEINAVISRSAENDYRIVETLAAVIDSPLFRQ